MCFKTPTETNFFEADFDEATGKSPTTLEKNNAVWQNLNKL
jgi:hypothetical protein